MGLISSNLAGRCDLRGSGKTPKSLPLQSGCLPCLAGTPSGCCALGRVRLFPGGASSWVGEAGYHMVFPEPQIPVQGIWAGSCLGPQVLRDSVSVGS